LYFFLNAGASADWGKLSRTKAANKKPRKTRDSDIKKITSRECADFLQGNCLQEQSCGFNIIMILLYNHVEKKNITPNVP